MIVLTYALIAKIVVAIALSVASYFLADQIQSMRFFNFRASCALGVMLAVVVAILSAAICWLFEIPLPHVSTLVMHRAIVTAALIIPHTFLLLLWD